MGSSDSGDNGAAAAREQAAANSAKAAQQYEGLTTPDVVNQMRLDLQNYKLVGQMQGVAMPNTTLEQVNVDPRLKKAQLNALQGLQERAQEGYTAEDRSLLEKARRGAEQQAVAQNASIMQNMQERGMGGSGNELAARLISGQQSATRQGQDALSVAADSSKAKREAMMQAAQLGGQMQQQDYSQQANLAQARDAIAQMNAKQRFDVQNANLQAQQQAANANTEMANTQQQYNKSLIQQNYGNQLALAGGKAGAYSGAANMYAGMAGQMGSGGPSQMQGAVAGAGTGAAIGSSFGPGYGTAIGAGVGAVAGYYGAKKADGGIVKNGEDFQYRLNKHMQDNKQKYSQHFEDGGMPLNLEGGSDMQYASPEAAPMPAEAPQSLADLKQMDDKSIMDAKPWYEKLFGTGNMTPEQKDKLTKNIAGAFGGLTAVLGGGQRQSGGGGGGGYHGADFSSHAPQLQNSISPLALKPAPKFFSHGGVVNGDSYVGDKVPSMTNSGEVVLNIANQQRAEDLLKGKNRPYVGNRVDDAINNGKAVLNTDAQRHLFELLSGKRNDVPEEDVVRPASEDETNLHEKNMELEARLSALEKMIRG